MIDAHEDFATSRRRLAGDPQRPCYHFLPPRFWMNDPNGLIHWRGRYHLFYQHHPKSADWGPMHWGHAVSEDLVRWTDLPIALTPIPGHPHREGCWSGCAVDDNGTPLLLFTGVGPRGDLPEPPQAQCAAVGDAACEKFEVIDTPLLDAPPAGLDVVGFRDPFVWRADDGSWRMLIGSGLRGVGGTVLVYRCSDLRNWTYSHQLLTGDTQKDASPRTGVMWECPQLLRFGDRRLLVISVQPGSNQAPFTICFVGRLVNERYVTEHAQRFDHGSDFYAPAAMRDERGRWLMWGWCWEARERSASLAAGWAGVMSLPRVVTLGEDGRPRQNPAEELAALRGEAKHVASLRVEPGTTVKLDGVAGDALEIDARFEVSSRVSLLVRCSPGGEEFTAITLDRAAGRIELDRNRASVDTNARGGVFGVPWSFGADGAVRVRVFVDRSLVELFIGEGEETLTCRVYPTRMDSVGVALRAEGGAGVARGLTAWRMRPIWPVA